MPIIRGVVSISTDSGLPEDAIQNTYHFDVPIVTTPILDEIATDVKESVYDQIDTYLSVNLAPATTTIRFYSLADPEPRQVIHSVNIGNDMTNGTGALPDEVALVASFQAQAVSGQPQARRRGRVFIGPLGTAAAGAGAAGNRPAAAFVAALAAAMASLENNADLSTNYSWVVYSPTDGVGRVIEDGWVDDAFDTQRRRGVDPTSRTTWT